MNTNNLKPFNLERAIAGDPVVTREGQKIQELYHFKKCTSDYKLYGVINEKLYVFSDDGVNPYESRADLFMAPKTKKLWIAVGKNLIEYCGESYHRTTHAYTKKTDCPTIDGFKEIEIEIEV